VVLNEGTLEMRSITAFGTGTTTSLVLNRGTLNLRRDTAGVYGGSAATAYPVTVNGNSTISADRAGTTGSGFVEGLGAVTLNGNSTLTTTNGNGVILEFASLALNGNGLLNIGSSSITNQDSGTKVTGAVTGGSLVRSGGGWLHLSAANTTYTGGTILNAGTTRLRAAGAAGTGTITLNPGATIDFNSANNLNPGQALVVRSTTAFPSMISMNTDVAHPTAGVDTSNAPFGIIGLSNSPGGIYNTPINLNALYGGGWSLGGVPQGAYDPRYTAATLGAGNGNVYRLGGGGTSFFMGMDSTGAALNNVLTGAANSVRLGIDSGNIIPANGGNFQFVLGGNNNYGGTTVIHRGMAARLGSAAAGGFSGLSNTAVDLFGSLNLSSGATLQDGGVATNALTFHPGSILTLDNNGGINTPIAAANVADRIADGTPIQLNGAALNLIGANTLVSAETVGAVTYQRGARLRVGANGAAGTATLTLGSLTRAGAGSSLLLQTSAAGTLGGVDRILVTAAPTVTNGMVDASITNATDGQFVTYGASGFANATYDNTFIAAGTLTPGMAATAKVSVDSSGTLVLGDNADIFALRTNRDINNGGPFNQLRLRSGGLIGTGNALTIQPNLIFNDGTTNVEAKITALNTINLNGSITAAGVTKSGNGAVLVNVPQTDYASGWTVNSGDLQFNDLEAAGQSVAGNAITVNATQTTGGINGSTLNGSRVIFNRDMGTSELYTFTGGPITVVNDGAVRIAGGDNRNLQIPSITALSTGAASTVGLTVDVPNNRFRATIPSLTLSSDTTLRVLDSGSTADTGRITAAVVDSLVGASKNLLKIGNRTLELGGDNSASFTGGSIVNSQGTLRVLHDGALGSATTAVTIERNATLEIGKGNFVPTATVTQLPGSIERWNQEDARGALYNLPTGVNLQLNTNLQATRTIGLSGGTIEGFLHADHVAQTALRTVGSEVTLNLLANSYVGQGNLMGGQNYDAGRLPTVGQPFGDTYTGSPLMISGPITGAFNLTKTGLDTVTIAGTANTYRNTIVDMGTLRIGANNALPSGGVLTPRLGGIVDLYGSNQTVAGLGYATAGPNPGGVSAGSAGIVTNSGTVDKVLTVNSAADHTYNGTLELNVALTKTGAGAQVLGGTNTYRGATNVNGGTLFINGDNSGANGLITVASAATLGGSGTLGGDLNVLAGGIFAPGNSPGTLTTTGSASFGSTSVLRFELNGGDTTIGGGVNDLFTGVTTLTLDGLLDISETVPNSFLDLAGLGDTWRLINYSGALTDNGLTVNAQPALPSGLSFNVDTNTAGQVNLVVVPETSSVGLLGLTALLTLRRRRRAA
jgi:autotransporter-associated beta strand protein